MPEFLTSFFVHPELVIPGAALIAAPIIIHFINRLRFRRVKWAAMEFLLASQQRNRRRLLLEQLLLLLLRILAVVGLVLLVARPILDPQRLSLFDTQKAHHLVLLDDSGSMRDRGEDSSAFEAALNVVRKLAAEGERRPDSQMLTLLLASNPSQPVFNQENLNKAFISRLETSLKALHCSHQALDLAAACEAARKFLAENPGAARSLHLVSDFRKEDWEGNPALAGVIRDLDLDNVAVNLVKTVAESHSNLGITSLTGSVDVAAVNVPLRLSVTVQNYGEKVAQNVRLTVLVDGLKRPAVETIDEIEPGKSRTLEFDEQFSKTGPHDVQVSLPADSLEADNVRFLSIVVPETNPVLIIDGTSAESEAFYLVDALGADPEKTGFSPTLDRVESLRRRPLDKFRCIFLLNVSELPPEAVKALEQYVAAGGGLAWFLGPQVRAPFYDEQLYKNGQGIFPARLGVISDLALDATDPSPDFRVTNHPVFDLFQDSGEELLSYTKVTRYVSVPRDWIPPDGVRVIASLRNKAPLALEHRFGKGRVVTFMTACSTTWTNWPRLPDVFVVTQLQLATYLSEGHQTLNVRTVGEPLAISLDAATYAPQVEIRQPDGLRVALTVGVKKSGSESESPATAADKLLYEDLYRNTDDPGVYSLLVKRQDGGEETQRFAFNVPAAESQLTLAP
ncbi:MAG: BatA domain-containing protein, partial [Planctomycetes bacterium]|nr:BatA domain-containing protein [Planctomycetota bacterium]